MIRLGWMIGAAIASLMGGTVPAAAKEAAPVELQGGAPVVNAADIAPLSADELASITATGSSSSGYPRLSLYGFADFNYVKTTYDDDSLNNSFANNRGDFQVGNLNLYLDSEIAPSWRSLIEVRFTYLPNGSAARYAETPGTTNTEVADYSSFYRPTRWSGIEIQRAYVEHRFDAGIWLRAGQWLTPFGIWNVDHGSVTLIPMIAPYCIGDRLFPQRQTGLELYGRTTTGDVALGYHFTLSNGRGPADEFDDLDKRFGFGARGYAKFAGIGDLTLGISGYGGRYTERTQSIGKIGDELGSVYTIGTQYDEITLGVDLRWEYRDVIIIGEALRQQRAFTDEGRPTNPNNFSQTTLRPDGTRTGGYLLIGYHLPFWNLMPFVLGQAYQRFPDDMSRRVDYLNAGVNMRVAPSVVLKAQWAYVIFRDIPDFSVMRDNFQVLSAQVAWAF